MKLGVATVFDFENDDIIFLIEEKPCVQGSWCLLINGVACNECCVTGCKEDYDAGGSSVGNWVEGGSCDGSPGGTSMLNDIFAMTWSYPTGKGSTCSACGSSRAQGSASCCVNEFPCVDAQGNPREYQWKESTASCSCGKAYGCYCDGTVRKTYACDTSGDQPTCVEQIGGSYSDLPSCEAAIAAGDCSVMYSCGISNLGNAICYKDPQGQFKSKKECEDYPCATRYKCGDGCEPDVGGMYATKSDCCAGCCGGCSDSPGRCTWFEASGDFFGIGFNYMNCAFMTRDQCLSHYSLSGTTAQFTCCTSGDCSCDGSQDCPPCPPGKRVVVKTGTFSGNKTCDCETECPACPFGQWQPFVGDCKCVDCSPCPAGSYRVGPGGSGKSCDCEACEAKYGQCDVGDYVVNSNNQCQCVQNGKVVWP